MYAIIRTGGKQYRVAEGENLRVERLNVEAGASVKLDEVLLLGGDGDARIGNPLVAGASVEASVIRQDVRAKKVLVFKKRKRTGYHKSQGHRQNYTELRITKINA